MTGSEILLLVLVVLGFAVVVFLLLRPRPDTKQAEVLQRIHVLEETLEADFSKATADMAARVTDVKGALQLELGDRLQAGLKESRGELAQGLTQLSTTLQKKSVSDSGKNSMSC